MDISDLIGLRINTVDNQSRQGLKIRFTGSIEVSISTPRVRDSGGQDLDVQRLVGGQVTAATFVNDTLQLDVQTRLGNSVSVLTTGDITDSQALTLTKGGGVYAARQAVAQALVAAAASAATSNPVSAADMSSPPTLSYASAHNATYSVQYNYVDNPTMFLGSPAREYYRIANKRRIAGTTTLGTSTGGIKTTYPTAGLVSPEPGTGDTTTNSSVTFKTSAQVIEIEMQPGSATVPYRLIVDGQYAARDGFLVDTASKQFVTVTFGSAALRTITVEFQFGVGSIGSVSVAAGSTLVAPGITPIKCAFTGDSFTEALNIGTLTNFFMFDGWSNVFTKLAVGNSGFQRNAGVGATGYWNQSGGGSGPRFNCRDTMDYWINDGHQYHLIGFAHGYNDAGQTSNATIRSLARQAWKKARANQPQALIVVWGVWGGNAITTDSASRLVTEGELKAEFQAWNDPFSMFIDVTPQNGFSQQTAWMYGNGDESTAATIPGNATLYVSNDHTHPNRAGHIYLGGKSNTAYRAQLPTIAARYGA